MATRDEIREHAVKPHKKRSKEPILTETILGVLAVLMLMLAALLIFSMVGAGGVGGEILFSGLHKLLGIFSYLTPLLCLYIAYYLWKEELPDLSFTFILGVVLLVVGVAGLGNMLFANTEFGGYIGAVVAMPLIKYFSVYPSEFILLGVSIIGGLIILNRKPSLHPVKKAALLPVSLFQTLLERKKGVSPLEDDNDARKKEEPEEALENVVEEEEEPTSNLRSELLGELTEEEEAEKKEKNKSEEKSKPIVLTPEFVPPPLDLLNWDTGNRGAGDTKSKMNTIERTLEHFKINVEMGEVTVGPTVTQFTLKPAQGVNLSKISALHDNLAMELGSEYLRIEAPIPGKTLVGIEVPNEKKQLLGLRSMLELPQFSAGGPLTVAIGKSIIGQPVFGDLEKMPHLLVAGATRSGKSVTLQNLLISLLYKNSPHDLKLIILDPKRVEFTAYSNLPHLYTPIIKEPKTGIKALNWAIQEMERRYEVLSEHGQVNVSEYNKKVLGPALERARKKGKTGDTVSGLPPKMPYVIITFDEYNDFMLSYPKEISPLITALTQKGRAAGIHLILATQRPDVRVITGTIKANIPARIAFKTTSQVDSRTILDISGAEDLLGNGDMLYMASDNPRLLRLQAPFVSMEEVKAVISHIKQDNLEFLPEQLDMSKVKVAASGNSTEGEETSDTEPEDDEDYMSAKDYVISTGKASTSSLQTAFRWGYNKAARIINDLERFQVIGPARPGERYREVLVGTMTGNQEEDVSSDNDKTADDIFRT